MSPELNRLAELLPGPQEAPDRAQDWEAAEAELGTVLPADYRELIEPMPARF
ncbi:hypothetical protein [Streptomyces sp. NPDC052107]|uniref:hypothetical protein n=1 Tax=Streptomyces sp. NPDC052107 TaxID=3155632 RepID=UPI00342E1D4D